MAFKRTNFATLVKRTNNSFKSVYSFSKKVGGKFEVGNDAYFIPLGLESGFFETPCHRIQTHKAPNGETIGFKGSPFASYIKCKGEDSEGNTSECIACALCQKERIRIPDKEKSGQRIVSSKGYRMHLPILLLGNSLGDPNKKSYPISKVSILNELRSESGLRFSYLEMSSDTFYKEIVRAYGTKLKEDGILEYDLSEDSEEFINEVISRLPNTIIKVHGVSKAGFAAAMKEYSFFPFDNPAIATGSPSGEREAIVGYKENQEIQNKICEFLDLFNVEVDNMFPEWSDKDLLEYYNSALGLDIHTPLDALGTGTAEAETPQATEVTETVEVITTPQVNNSGVVTATVPVQAASAKANPPVSDDGLNSLLDGITAEATAPVATATAPAATAAQTTVQKESDSALDEFEFDPGEDDFFSEE